MTRYGDELPKVASLAGERQLHNETVTLKEPLGILPSRLDGERPAELMAWLGVRLTPFMREEFMLVRMWPRRVGSIALPPRLLMADEDASELLLFGGNLRTLDEVKVGCYCVSNVFSQRLSLGLQGHFRRVFAEYGATDPLYAEASISKTGSIDITATTDGGIGVQANWSAAFDNDDVMSEPAGVPDAPLAKVISLAPRRAR